jgi:phosphohistidine phosphatase
MELLLIRHGEATPVGQDGVRSDEGRDLTERGIDRTKNAALALRRIGLRLNAVLASPYPRAMHTAKLICEGLESRPQLRSCDGLRPDAAIKQMVDEIRLNSELKSIALVTHEPNLSCLSSSLLCGRQQPMLIFHTGAMAYMQIDVGHRKPAATLHWFLDCFQLDLIGRSE